MIRRALLFVPLFVAFLGLGQSFRGSWSAKLSLLPAVALDQTSLTLEADVAGFVLGGTSEFFGTDGFVWQTVTAKGALGPVDMEWTMLFGPLAPAFLYTLGKASLTFAGINFTAYSAMVGPNVLPYVFTGGPSGGTVAEVSWTADALKLSAEVGFGARKKDFTIVYTGIGTYEKIFPIDPFPGGFGFTYLALSAEGVPLCCGLSLDLRFSFVREVGFDELELTLKNIPICCGISFDVLTTFTTTAKRVELKPKWVGIKGCLAVYGDVQFVGGTIHGLELYGFKIRCELAECNYLEVLTAFNVAKIEEILEEDIFNEAYGEFQYFGLGFCGPGCCGGRWTVDLTIFFGTGGTLFDITRFVAEAKVPLMPALDLILDFTGGLETKVSFGWTFKF